MELRWRGYVVTEAAAPIRFEIVSEGTTSVTIDGPNLSDDHPAAACAVGRAATLCTFNVKHYRIIAGLTTEQPYTR